MRFSRTTILAGAAVPLTLGTLLATTGAASASTVRSYVPPRAAYGSMELGSPLQYEQFLALQGFGRYHGQVDYTNWTYAEPGSGVYAPSAGPQQLVFTYQGSQYTHTLNGGLKLVALSPDRLAFSGTGFSGTQTWTITGQVKDDHLKAVIAYDGSTYQVTLDGTIAADGSVTGTATAVNPSQVLTFTMPANTFVSVLHYIAPIRSDQIGRHDATFQFTIPTTPGTVQDGTAGVKVTVKVHDGGWGARHDTYAHGVTGTPLQPYPIIGGPGVTVSGR